MALLDIPKQNNTPMNITAKNYVMTRILEIKLHKLTPTITFDDVFKKCRIENAHNEIKRRTRECIVDFMQHLKDKGEIRNFELTKKAQSFYSIKFSYNSKSSKHKAKSVIENNNTESPINGVPMPLRN